MEAFNELKAAFKKCKDKGVAFVFDEDDTSLCAYNGNEVEELLHSGGSTPDTWEDTTEMQFVRTNAFIHDLDSDSFGVIFK